MLQCRCSTLLDSWILAFILSASFLLQCSYLVHIITVKPSKWRLSSLLFVCVGPSSLPPPPTESTSRSLGGGINLDWGWWDLDYTELIPLSSELSCCRGVMSWVAYILVNSCIIVKRGEQTGQDEGCGRKGTHSGAIGLQMSLPPFGWNCRIL